MHQISINHLYTNRIIISSLFSTFLPCFFHPSLSCPLQFIHPSPAFFHLSPKAQLVWISHPWLCVCVCMWRLKINIVICVYGGVGEIGGVIGEWRGVPTYLSGPLLMPDCASVHCVWVASLPNPMALHPHTSSHMHNQHTNLADGTRTQTHISKYSFRSYLKEKHFQPVSAHSHTNLVV